MPLNRDKLLEQVVTVFAKKCLTQQQIAQQTGVHQSQVSRILRGHFKGFKGNAAKICKYANVTKFSGRGKGSISAELRGELKQLLDGTTQREEKVLRLLKAIRNL